MLVSLASSLRSSNEHRDRTLVTMCDALQASVLLRKARDQAIPFALGSPVLLQVASPGVLKLESESPVCRVSPST